jgi:tRNA (guanine37-N1)-methyltransferase
VKVTVVTLLPELFAPEPASVVGPTAGVVGRAIAAGVLTVATINPREFTHDKHRTVDDTPYGGGPGMVMKPEPVMAAIRAAGEGRRILLSPAGAPLTQAKVRELAALDALILVCGRYEGIDERAIELGIDEEVSLGDYVLSGGELGALVVIDAVARLIPGTLGEPASADDESHSAGLLEYPQYTRPLVFEERAVPEILTGGNHAAIAAWRRKQAIARTAKRRPDLLARWQPSRADRKLFPDDKVHARTHVALVHHPVFDRTGAVVTTSLTNFDIHDLARSSLTYGLAGYHIVTPVTVHREKAERVARLWIEDTKFGRADDEGGRAHALQLVRTAPAVEDVIAELTAQAGEPPLVVGTSAKPGAFPAALRRTPAELVAEARTITAPVLLLFGTGWGLAESLIPSVSRVLTPIDGTEGWNHLSVRSAVAILLDRMFGS